MCRVRFTHALYQSCHATHTLLPPHSANVTLLPKPTVFRGTRPRSCRLLAANPRFLITDDDAGKKLLAWDTARGDALFVGEFWDDANWWDAAPGFHHLLPGMEPYWSPDGAICFVFFRCFFCCVQCNTSMLAEDASLKAEFVV